MLVLITLATVWAAISAGMAIFIAIHWKSFNEDVIDPLHRSYPEDWKYNALIITILLAPLALVGVLWEAYKDLK